MEHYFTQKPSSKLKIYQQEFLIKKIQKSIPFYSASGLFSIKKVDKGSELLINKAIIKPNQKILDLGCGYGIIGIAVKTIEPSAEITFSDINERAIEITKKNLEISKIKANIIQSDGFKNIKENFNTILLNPPQTAGKELCLKLIKESKEHLNQKGSLQIVARHNKGGKTLSNQMKKTFGNMKIIAKAKGYSIYYSEN